MLLAGCFARCGVMPIDPPVPLGTATIYVVSRGWHTDIGLPVEAVSGPQGLERFRTQQPDLVITDMRMPGVDGGEVIRKLREMSPSLRIVAVSGAAPIHGPAPSAAEIGADAILSKLSPLEEILLAIERMLETPTG